MSIEKWCDLCPLDAYMRECEKRIAELEAKLAERGKRERLAVEYVEAHEEYRYRALADIKDMGRKLRSEIAWRKHEEKQNVRP